MRDDQALHFAELVRTRRSVRDFLPEPVPGAVIEAVIGDAAWAPSWSNTQPYRVAVASGALKDRLKEELCALFDTATRAQRRGLLGKLGLLLTRKGLPDGDFSTTFPYPKDLSPARRATGFGLYEVLGIARDDREARDRQLRRNFEFFGAPTVMFLFVHEGLREFSALDAGIFLHTLMLSAHARGLATCAEGALATWAGPVRRAFEVPRRYKLICGLAIGHASPHPVNRYAPPRKDVRELLIAPRAGEDAGALASAHDAGRDGERAAGRGR
jgi:nitroreductase